MTLYIPGLLYAPKQKHLKEVNYGVLQGKAQHFETVVQHDLHAS